MVVLLRKVGFDISGLNRGCLRFFLYSRKTARRYPAGRNFYFRLLKPKFSQNYPTLLKSAKIKQILRKLAKTA